MHGHQIKSIATFVAAIIEKQTGNAELSHFILQLESAIDNFHGCIEIFNSNG